MAQDSLLPSLSSHHGERHAFRIGRRFATLPGEGRWGDRQTAYELRFDMGGDGIPSFRCVGEPWFDRRTAELIRRSKGECTDRSELLPLPPLFESVKDAYSVLVENEEVGCLFRFGPLSGAVLYYADADGVSPLRSRTWLIPGGRTRWDRPAAWLHESFVRWTIVPDSFETTPQTVLVAAFHRRLREHNA